MNNDATENANAERLLCAIDTVDLDAAVATAASLKGLVGGIKLGLEFFTAHGPAGVAAIADCGLPIFLDLKFFDIPNTVAGAIRGTSGMNPFMLTVHISGGPAMLRAAMAASSRLASQNDGKRPLVIGISVLTSFDEDDMEAVGVRPGLAEQVHRLADMGLANGLDGVVCSAHEILDLRRSFGDKLKLIVPGIRPAWSSADDQKRIVTPAEALRLGADYLVIGRPILRADDPPAAARRILAEMAG
ncbi:MAG: orotidine-5'-phosphate decarboxylase [Alphaproteobacteria bacterium]|jgi:orotidine-5'-phosphate decarboxylase